MNLWFYRRNFFSKIKNTYFYINVQCWVCQPYLEIFFFKSYPLVSDAFFFILTSRKFLHFPPSYLHFLPLLLRLSEIQFRTMHIKYKPKKEISMENNSLCGFYNTYILLNFLFCFIDQLSNIFFDFFLLEVKIYRRQSFLFL